MIPIRIEWAESRFGRLFLWVNVSEEEYLDRDRKKPYLIKFRNIIKYYPIAQPIGRM
jgi:hypothetical protein